MVLYLLIHLQIDEFPHLNALNYERTLKINEIRVSLLMRKDNHLIFIYLNSTPFDKGAKDYNKTNKLPIYDNLTFERANVKTVNNQTLISIPIKLNDRTLIEPEGITNCVRSLVNRRIKIEELKLNSLSVAQTDYYDNIPWNFMLKTLKT